MSWPLTHVQMCRIFRLWDIIEKWRWLLRSGWAIFYQAKVRIYTQFSTESESHLVSGSTLAEAYIDYSTASSSMTMNSASTHLLSAGRKHRKSVKPSLDDSSLDSRGWDLSRAEWKSPSVSSVSSVGENKMPKGRRLLLMTWLLLQLVPDEGFYRVSVEVYIPWRWPWRANPSFHLFEL